MDRAERAQLRRVLRGRGAAIAASWQRALARAAAADQRALAPPGAEPRPEPDVRRRLAELAERAVAILLAARFRRDGARAIGAALVALHYVDGAALGATQEVLARELGGDSLSPEQRLALQPRLAALLAAVAAGFCDQAREIISTQQAAAREASPVEQAAPRATSPAARGRAAERLQVVDHPDGSSTAARGAAEARRGGGERFRSAFEFAPIGMATLAPDGRYLQVNHAYRELFGYTAEELRRLGCRAISHPDDLAAGDRLFAELLAGEREHYSRDKRYYRRDGRLIWARVTVAPVRDAAGRVRYAVSMVEDITARQEAAEALRRGEARFRAIFEREAIGMSLIALDGRLIEANPALQEMLGYSGAELAGMPFSHFTHPDDRRADLASFRQLAAGKRDHDQIDKRYQRKDAQLVWGRLIRTLIRDAQGRPDFIVAMVQDITEQRRAQETIKGLNAGLERRVGERTMQLAVANQELRSEVTRRRWIEEERNRLLAREQAAHRRAAYLAEASRAFAEASGDLPAILEAACRRVADLLGDVCVIRLLSEDGRWLEPLAFHHPNPQARDLFREVLAAAPVGSDEGLNGEVVRSGRPLLIPVVRLEEIRDALKPEYLAYAERFGLHSALFVPLRARGRVIGVLNVRRETPGRPYTADDQAFLQELADRVALAVDNMRLYQQLAERERRLHDLLGKLLVAQEEERRRVAYDVHDGLAQVAASAHQHLQAFARRHSPRDPAARRELDRALELARLAVSEARAVVANLRPTALDDFGLAPALRLQVQRLQAEGWRVAYQEELGGERLPAPIETALFRVAQEALTNVQKHARTDRVEVALARRGRLIRLEVRDWGHGFEAEAGGRDAGAGERVGLAGMRERIAQLGGRWSLDSRPGEGTRVVAEVPLEIQEAVGRTGE